MHGVCETVALRRLDRAARAAFRSPRSRREINEHAASRDRLGHGRLRRRLSPSGDRVAYVATANDRRRVVVKKAGGGGLFAVDLGALKPEDVVWLGNDHLLVEASQASHVDLNGDTTPDPTVAVQSTIIDVAAAKAANVFGGQLRVNPATFGFDGYAEDGGAGHAYFQGATVRDSGGGDSL